MVPFVTNERKLLKIKTLSKPLLNVSVSSEQHSIAVSKKESESSCPILNVIDTLLCSWTLTVYCVVTNSVTKVA